MSMGVDAVRKEELIKKLAAMFTKRLPAEQANLLSEFTKQYLAYTSMDDLSGKEIDDLYGALMSHWNFLYQRKPGEIKLRVYNPDFERDGWQSTHTIIELAMDDMPFIVDSLQMEINRLGFTIHLMIHIGGIKFVRNQSHKVVDVLPVDTLVANDTNSLKKGAPVYIEIDKQTDQSVLDDLHQSLLRVLSDVEVCVEDWQKMQARIDEILTELSAAHLPEVSKDELAETNDFLKWLKNNHFTFLGARDYHFVGSDDKKKLDIVAGSGLGVLRDERASKSSRALSRMPIEAQRLALSPTQVIIIAKTDTESTVHRSGRTDYIGIKLFNKKGEVVGERRFVGLYTSVAYNSNPKHIPFLRRKVATVLKKSLLPPAGHAGKALLNILETLPRDDLFQATSDELLDLSVGILQMQERQQIRLFARKDIYGRFISCLVYVPRDRFNTDLREKIQTILLESFHGESADYFTKFSDSVLACIHFVVRIDRKKPCEYDIKAIEVRIVDAARTWQDDLRGELIDFYGEEKGIYLFNRYSHAIPLGYVDAFTPRAAVFDIGRIETISDENPLAMCFSKSIEDEGSLRLKLYSSQTMAELSDVLPILENMGMHVIGERPHRVRISKTQWYWINDFSLRYCSDSELGIDSVSDLFQDAFKQIWLCYVENDGFNRLVLEAGISWQEICILRAYAKYCRQIGFTYSQSLIEHTLQAYPDVARLLIELFSLRFDPTKQKDNTVAISSIEAQLQKQIDSVTSLDQDRILRRYRELILATLRTNYYQLNEKQNIKSYLSFKFDPSKITDLPLPRPMFEIFVYSPRFEGVHLRGAKVARGGLRWSDRLEDFRTEVLGLMKAQQVKNALIVPLGAKGGFVAKCLPLHGDREAILQEGILCYQNFIRGLLDITDNLKDASVIKPSDVVCYDEDDTYLVVAADKGTATFSDIANEIAGEYQFWLGDAFASGGRTGYDHKKMAITARGAWEAVKHHFRTLDLNIQEEPFTVIGIGDMAGDVFGNGMLLSRQIKLVAAFNHMHIFFDPNPDPESSFLERERLFNARSGWSEYNKSILSPGGGIFLRSTKSIQITAEMKQVLGVNKDYMVPNDLIRAILMMKVDLFWNGGIGTFVKSHTETHGDAGDRGNDLIRVDAHELACRVVGEGGNLGFTQLARIEYELNGGLINTDFIDNSAGVDCSDHEVNIKILLNDRVKSQDMTEKQRNLLLADMTEEVASLVLKHNYQQSEAISSIKAQSQKNLTVITRYMQAQERYGRLSREIEFLPSDTLLAERRAANLGLTRPEVAVLLSYSKNITKQEILDSEIPEDPYLSRIIEFSFPEYLRDKYREFMQQHTLRREMVATRLSNFMTDDMGISFVHQLHDESGASIGAIVRAYAVARQVFMVGRLLDYVSSLDYKVSAKVQTHMLVQISQLTRRATRWFLRNRPQHIDIDKTIDHFRAAIKVLVAALPKMIVGHEKEVLDQVIENYTKAGVPEDIALQIASTGLIFSALDIVDGAAEVNVDVETFGYCYFTMGDKLELSWINKQVMDHIADDYWTAIARTALRDDIAWQQRGLTISVLALNTKTKELSERIEQWVEAHTRLVSRWHSILSEIRTSTADLTRLSVAIRVLMDLSEIGFHGLMADEEHAK